MKYAQTAFLQWRTKRDQLDMSSGTLSRDHSGSLCSLLSCSVVVAVADAAVDEAAAFGCSCCADEPRQTRGAWSSQTWNILAHAAFVCSSTPTTFLMRHDHSYQTALFPDQSTFFRSRSSTSMTTTACRRHSTGQLMKRESKRRGSRNASLTAWLEQP